MALIGGPHGSTKAANGFSCVFSLLRNKTRLQRAQGLPLVVGIQRRLNRQDSVEQSSVARRTAGSGNFRWLGSDETFLLQHSNTLCNRVWTQRSGLSDFLIAWVALISFPVLAVE